MPPFRPPRERIDLIARRILEAIGRTPGLQVANADEAASIIRNIITENLRAEHEIEEEVMETLRKHGQKIYEQNADFQKLLMEGKKVVAKKRNFTL